MSSTPETRDTGTADQTYDVVAVLYHALQGAENCERYRRDATDEQARGYFERALEAQRRLAEEGKQVLRDCLRTNQSTAAPAHDATDQFAGAQAARDRSGTTEDLTEHQAPAEGSDALPPPHEGSPTQVTV